MKNYIVIFLCSMSFLLNGMDFDSEILWLHLIPHDQQRAHSRQPKTYYLDRKQQSPLTVLKNQETITKIAGNSTSLSQTIEFCTNSSKSIDSTSTDYKLRDARTEKNIKMIAFLNEQGHVLRVISQAQL